MYHGITDEMTYTFINDNPRRLLYMYVIEDYITNTKTIE